MSAPHIFPTLGRRRKEFEASNVLEPEKMRPEKSSVDSVQPEGTRLSDSEVPGFHKNLSFSATPASDAEVFEQAVL